MAVIGVLAWSISILVFIKIEKLEEIITTFDLSHSYHSLVDTNIRA